MVNRKPHTRLTCPYCAKLDTTKQHVAQCSKNPERKERKRKDAKPRSSPKGKIEKPDVEGIEFLDGEREIDFPVMDEILESGDLTTMEKVEKKTVEFVEDIVLSGKKITKKAFIEMMHNFNEIHKNIKVAPDLVLTEEEGKKIWPDFYDFLDRRYPKILYALKEGALADLQFIIKLFEVYSKKVLKMKIRSQIHKDDPTLTDDEITQMLTERFEEMEKAYAEFLEEQKKLAGIEGDDPGEAPQEGSLSHPPNPPPDLNHPALVDHDKKKQEVIKDESDKEAKELAE